MTPRGVIIIIRQISYNIQYVVSMVTRAVKITRLGWKPYRGENNCKMFTSVLDGKLVDIIGIMFKTWKSTRDRKVMKQAQVTRF